MKTTSKAAVMRTSATVRIEIDLLDEAAEPRLGQLAEFEAQRPALVEAGDIDAIEALDAKIRRSRIEGEVDNTRRAKLVAEHDTLRAGERYAAEQAVRRTAYDAAREAADEAARLYREEYPRLARKLAKVLARTTEIGKQVEAANSSRPDGAGLISMEFEPFRGRAEIRPKTRKTRRHVWVDRQTGEEALVRHEDKKYDRRVKEEEITSPGAMAIPHVPLRNLVSLPGLGFGDAPFWAPHGGFLAPPGSGVHGAEFLSAHQYSAAPANPPLGGTAPRSMAHLGGRS